MSTATLRIEADDEREELRRIVAGITHDYPFEPDLDTIARAITRLTTCSRMLRMAKDGHGLVDASLVDALREEEKDLVDAVAYEQGLIDRVSAPGANLDDWHGDTLAEVRRNIEETRDRFAHELAVCRRLIARADSLAVPA